MPKEDKFYIEVSKRCNYIDPEMVKEIYLAIIRTILSELRYKNEIVLPRWGTFKTKHRKERIITDVNTKEKRLCPKTRVISFVPDYKLKKYIKEML